MRAVVCTGLIAAAGFGALPLVPMPYWGFLLTRLGLGLGVGLFSPHALGLIARTYRGDFRARLLGYQTGLSALGNALLMALAGLVVAIAWRSVFALYLLLLPLAFLAARVLPGGNAADETITDAAATASVTQAAGDEHASAAPGQARADARAGLPLGKWGLCALAFLTYLLIWGVQLKLSALFAAHGGGGAAVANWTLAAMNVGGLVAGLTFGRLHRRLGALTLAVGYLGAALGVWAMLIFHQPAGAVAAAVFFNWIYSYTGPYLVYRTNLGLAPSQIDLAASALTIATVTSAFAAPPVWNWLGRLGTAGLTENALGWIAGILAAIAIGTLIAIRLLKGAEHDRS
ncbi:MFS transporter [Lacticaseibacillus kribbianus]|uniref:MFS transporter n=1 Tax=Lacticaseibacillus kribbianus TaxID=2926292 RepID=UPI0030844F08